MKTTIQCRVESIEDSISSNIYKCNLAEPIHTVLGVIDTIHVPMNIELPELNTPGLNIYIVMNVNIDDNNLIDAIHKEVTFTSVIAAV